jgi:mono/diheme cytochrome c family protein
MTRTRALASVGVVLAVAAFLPASAQQAQTQNPAPTAATASALQDTLQIYCIGCHNGPTPFAGLNLDTIDFNNLEAHGETWEKLIRKLRARQMPPAGMPRPSEATYEALVNFIQSGRDHLAEVKPNPGRATLHRLNRPEYANVIHDLLALDIDVNDLLPADDIGYGFDNIGDVLSVSPLLMERYLATASKVARTAVGDTSMPVQYQTYTIPHGLRQINRVNEEAPVGSRGGTIIRHFFPVDGEYEISVTLQRDRNDLVLGMDRDRKLDLRLDDERLALFDIPANETYAGARAIGGITAPDANLKIRIPVKAGTREIAATFLKDTVLREGVIERVRDDAVATHFEGVGTIHVVGPYKVQGLGDTASREKIFICHPAARSDEQACAGKILANLAHHAYRRPVTAGEMSQLISLYRQGAQSNGFESGVRLALQKILVSPAFIFRAEYDPPAAAPGSVHRVSDIELASRLSFFLWSSIPDDELLAAAESGKLSDKSVLAAQVKRMLADPRSRELVKNFAGQYLYLRNIERVVPDPQNFPNFDENLRAAMATETEMVVESTLRENRPIPDLLKTDYTFLNQRLARHYGIKGIYGNEFRRVTLTDPNRFGLLGQASILTVTSYPNRTAPTIRGKWVLLQILGTPPPPPPPNVPSLKNDETVKNLTMRQRMELHRSNPTCAACHKMMDPLGFALENYDGIGQWRANMGPGTPPIDSSGVLPDGTQFQGPAGLREVLASKQDMFVETFTEALLTYALGRGVEEYDRPVLRQITREAALDNYRWSDVILGIVNSTPFQMRRSNDANN